IECFICLRVSLAICLDPWVFSSVLNALSYSRLRAIYLGVSGINKRRKKNNAAGINSEANISLHPISFIHAVVWPNDISQLTTYTTSCPNTIDTLYIMTILPLIFWGLISLI